MKEKIGSGYQYPLPPYLFANKQIAVLATPNVRYKPLVKVFPPITEKKNTDAITPNTKDITEFKLNFIIINYFLNDIYHYHII